MNAQAWSMPLRALRGRLDHEGRIVFDFGLQTVLFLAVFTLFEFTVASPRAGLLAGAVAVIIVGLCLALIKGIPTRWIASTLVAVLVLSSSSVVILSGGRSVAALAMLPILVFLVVLLQGGPLMWLWLIVVLILPGVAVLLQQLPYAYPIDLSLEWRQDSILLAAGMLVLYVLAVGRAYRGAIDAALTETEVHIQMWREESAHAMVSEQRFRDFADEAAAILWETDHDLAITYLSNGFETLIGQPIEACLGLTPMAVFERFGVEVEDIEDWLLRSDRREPFDQVKLRWPIGGGRRLILLDSGRPYQDARGRFAGYRGVIQDVTAAEEARAKLQQQARCDGLTGLLNRRAFLSRVSSALSMAHQRGGSLALAFVDLDHFKQVNDEGGHGVGDELLAGVARALDSAAGPRGDVGRIGGDEFCVLWPDVEQEWLQQAGEELLRAVTGFRLLRGGRGFGVGCSVGIAWQAPVSEPREDVWLSVADGAAYAAKASGRGQVRLSEVPEGKGQSES